MTGITPTERSPIRLQKAPLSQLHPTAQDQILWQLRKCGYLQGLNAAPGASSNHDIMIQVDGSSPSTIFVIPLGPPSLKPWLGAWTGWLSAVVLLSTPSATPPTCEDLEFDLWFVLGFRLGVEECSCGTCGISFWRGEVCTGDDDFLLAVSRDVVRGEMRPVYKVKALELASSLYIVN
jgi:hypothetical protein